MVAVLVALALRIAVVPATGFSTDVSTFMAWAGRLASVGPGAFYEPGYFADYPPGFLYVLWAIGALAQGDALRLLVKSLSIPFDLGIAFLAASLARRWAGEGAARLSASLWLLAPAAIVAGPLWGQVDAVGTLVLLGALAAGGQRRWVLSGALAGLAAMVKPQLGVGLIVLGVAAVWDLIHGDRRPIRAIAAASLVIVILGVPFRSGPLELLALVRDAAATYPYSSLYAFNVWSLILDFWVADDPYVVTGGLLLALGLIGACIVAVRRRSPDRFLVAGALATMAFYFLPTRAHERYLFPALVLVLPMVASRRVLLAPYLTLSLSFAMTLLFALTRYPGNLTNAPDWLEGTLYGRPGQVILALLMMGSGAWLAAGLVRGRAPVMVASAPVPLATGPGIPSEATALGPEGPPMRPRRPPRALPAGLGQGHAPTRHDILVALLVAVAMLLTRGYRLDMPRDMYFDEVYHARTAFELLAQREPYEWTHPHLAKEIMALSIPIFGGDRVTGVEPLPSTSPVTALAAAGNGIRAIGLADGTVQLRDRGGGGARDIAHLAVAPRALAIEGTRVVGATDTAVFAIDTVGDALTTRTFIGPLSGFAISAGRVVVVTPDRVLLFQTLAADPLSVDGGAVAVTAKPDGGEVYALDERGTVRVLDLTTGAVLRTVAAGGPAHAIAYAAGPNRLFVARSDEPSLGVIDLEGGRVETVRLANARTGSFASGATALAVVPRSQFLYALADGRVVVVETHGASPYAQIPVPGWMLAVDGEAESLLVGGEEGVTLIETGRHALAWRLPGVVAGAVLAFFLVLIARRLFASRALPWFVAAVVLLDGSMFAQPRIGMNDVYTALFIVAGWYFVIAAHAPRRSRRADLLLAGLCFGLAVAAKWTGAYALGGVFLASLVMTVRAARGGETGSDSPLDLLRGGGRNAAFLFACFALVPFAVYVGSFLSWFGGPTAPYGWDLLELTRQMYGYHSGLTSPHPAGSPWWSWPLDLKPVYWYYGQSTGGQNAYIYDAGNIALFWAALAATVWCAVTAVRTRSLRIGFVVFALLVQYVAWIPITRVLFFYHFFTALPFYLLALAVVLAVLWERRERAPVIALLAFAAAVAIFFYPFVSGLPVDASSASMYFVLPTWQYDCQFYPAEGNGLRCDLSGGAVDVTAVLARVMLAGGVTALVVSAALIVSRLSGGRRSS